MPNCFQLYPIGSTEPARLVAIDDAMCAYFNVHPHPTDYHYSWVDIIGFRLACGASWDSIRADLADHAHMLAIIDWLAANYTPHAWRENRAFGDNDDGSTDTLTPDIHR